MSVALERLLGEVAAGLPGAAATVAAGVTTWTHGGTAFADLGPNGAEFRLDRAIAEAAARTPDAGPSARGPEWVRFNPRELDGHAVDRARAWMELAYRRAN